MKLKRTYRLSFAALLLGAFLSPLSAQTDESITLRQGLDGYTGVSDTILVGATATSRTQNFGAFGSMLVGAPSGGSRRSLLRFDLTSFDGRTVSSDGTLRLTQVNTGSSTAPFQIHFYQVAEANADWIEGSGNGVAATAGEPTWNYKAKGGSGQADTPWAGSVGMGTSGTDYIGTAVATITYNPDNNLQDVFVTIPQELLQFWVDNPIANGGLLLMGDVGGVLGGFRSSAWSDLATRPELSFSLAQVPEASTYAMIIAASALVGVLVVRRRRTCKG